VTTGSRICIPRDGVVVVGDARIEGREAVRVFYQKTFDAIHPRPEV
jgi:hypothetical protein